MPQPKILVADDSRTIRAFVHRALAPAGFDVILACDGQEAVQVAQRDHPDLVIMDIQMPHMDGYAASVQILSLDQHPRKTPIVFLTNDSAQHLNALGSQLGAYLRKPVCEQTLLSTVESLLSEADECTQPQELQSSAET